MRLFLRRLFNCFFSWHILPATENELKTADCIVTQAFSRLSDGGAGPGNEILARVAETLQKRLSLPLLVQEEISIALPELRCDLIVKSSSDGRSSATVNTYSVAKEQTLFCRKKGWKRVIVVVYPYHMGRAVWTYQRFGLDAIPAWVPQRGYEHPKLVHWVCQGGAIRICFMLLRELLCRILFLALGKI